MKRTGKKKSFKITDDTLTSIVIYSLLFCAAVTVVAFYFGTQYQKGKDGTTDDE